MNKNDELEYKLNKIEEFFDGLSLEEFEKMSFEAGLGRINESGKSSYVLAIDGYSSTIANFNIDNNFEFQISREAEKAA